MKPIVHTLRCEYMDSPVGVDTMQPRFSWQINHDERNQLQSAYQILVASTADLLKQDCGDCWDSGIQQSGQSLHVRYDGAHLKSAVRYHWKVRTADKNGNWGAYSQPSSFVTAVLNPLEWKADWMGFAGGANGMGIMARYAFSLKEQPAEAYAFACGLGWYELSLNGCKVGDRLMEPSTSDYSKRILYSSYEVTDFLSEGENVVGFLLGNGWYGAPRFLLQMLVRYKDGSEELVLSGPDIGWQVKRGPLGLNSIFDGETYDARLERDGWNKSDYDFAKDDRIKGGWIHAMALDPPGGVLVSQMMEPVRVVETLPLTKLQDLNDGSAVYDAGRNIAGFAFLRVHGQEGTVVTLRFGETLYPDGQVNQENLRTAEAVDRYILKGVGEEEWAPRFTYHGFRYVQVYIDGNAEILTLEARHIRNDVSRTGHFRCSDNLLNAIDELIVNTESNNLHGVPTDCPQRDERMGWLNDATVRLEEAIYHFGLAAFLEKWMWDIRDTQGEDGSITDTAPLRFGTRPADPVCTSFLLIPWYIYLHYGDKSCLETHYPALKGWVSYMGTLADDNIIEYSRFGDWASPRSESEDTAFGSGARSATTPGPFISTCYYYYNALLMERYACLLGHKEDEIYYHKLGKDILESILNRWYDKETGRFATGSQGCQSLGLMLKLAPDTDLILARLLDEIKRHNFHLSTGNQTTKYMLEMLSQLGHGDVALKIATQKTYPSWGYMLENGATTLWERWELESSKEMNSHNHPMHGALGAWFFKHLAGVRPLPEGPGFTAVEFYPDLSSGLSHAEAELETPLGRLFFSWKKEERAIQFNLEVPVNTQARLRIPFKGQINGDKTILDDLLIEEDENGLLVKLGSGKYCFSFSEFVIKSSKPKDTLYPRTLTAAF